MAVVSFGWARPSTRNIGQGTKREFKIGDKIRVNLYRGQIDDAIVNLQLGAVDPLNHGPKRGRLSSETAVQCLLYWLKWDRAQSSEECRTETAKANE